MLIDAIKNRFSVRKFKEKKIETGKINELLIAAQLAPSARNKQNWHFVVITDDNKRGRLVEICNGQRFVGEAPLVIAVCASDIEYKMSCGENAYTVDAAIAAEHIVLQAVELGLGSCWVGAFDQDKIAKLIELPSEYRVVTLLPIGYPDIEKQDRNLKGLSEMVSYNKF